MGFNTGECEWKKIRVTVLTRTIVGLLGFEMDKEVDQEALMAAGDEPIDIQKGNKKYEGSLDCLKYEVDGFNDAAQDAGYEDITDVPPDLIVITVVYKNKLTDPARTITATGVGFGKMNVGMKQGAKKTEVNLPFIALKITHQKRST